MGRRAAGWGRSGVLGVTANGSDRGEHKTLLSAVVFRDAPHDLHQLSGESVHIAWNCDYKRLHNAIMSTPFLGAGQVRDKSLWLAVEHGVLVCRFLGCSTGHTPCLGHSVKAQQNRKRLEDKAGQLPVLGVGRRKGRHCHIIPCLC